MLQFFVFRSLPFLMCTWRNELTNEQIKEWKNVTSDHFCAYETGEMNQIMTQDVNL